MNGTIYYFSGTGNSLSAAKQIVEKMECKTNLLPIKNLIKNDEVEIIENVLGFVFPVHYLSAPETIKKFIERINFKSSPYIFAVATCNSVSGGCVFELRELLAKRGQQLSAGFTVVMPGNAKINTPEEQEQKLIASKKRFVEISDYINRRNFGNFEGIDMKYEDIPKDQQVYISPDMFWSNQDCSSCGTCSKVCPSNNICLSEAGKPVWGSNCTTCFACFHWCPRNSVKIGQFSSGMPQYHNPEISLVELIDK